MVVTAPRRGPDRLRPDRGDPIGGDPIGGPSGPSVTLLLRPKILSIHQRASCEGPDCGQWRRLVFADDSEPGQATVHRSRRTCRLDCCRRRGDGRDGEVRALGTIANRDDAVRKLIKKPGGAQGLRACYEAGPTGYALYWQLAELGVDCEVIAPTLVPTKAGDRVKTDRRDAMKLARCFRGIRFDASSLRCNSSDGLHPWTERSALAWERAQGRSLI